MKKELPPPFAERNLYADFPRRTLAFMLDCMVLGVPYLVLFVYAFPRLLNDEVMFWYYDSWLNASWFSAFVGFNIAAGLAFLPLAVYSACFHALPMQATPGKRIMGIKVVDYQGKGIHFIHAFIRQWALTVCGIPTLMIGLVLVSFTQYRQGHHDSLCDTYVIKRAVSGSNIQPPRRLHPVLVGAALLVGALGIWSAINMTMWVNRTWNAWETANQVVVVYKHAQLVHLMGDFMRHHDGHCPVSGRDFEQEGSPEKALLVDARRYFEGINFKRGCTRSEFRLGTNYVGF